MSWLTTFRDGGTRSEDAQRQSGKDGFSGEACEQRQNCTGF